MKRLIVSLFCLALSASAALAMEQSSIPPKFSIPWGNSAGAPYINSIPVQSQIGVQNCRASLTDGFPPLTFVPSTAGGCPPFGADFNGIFKQITQWSQWQGAGGPVTYDSGFSSAIGGYPKGTILQSAILVGKLWLSTADNNTTNPDDTTGASANWVTLPGTYQPGTPIPTLSTAQPPNTVSANGLTVGGPSSNATSRANQDTFWLFSFLWSNCSTCQLFNSSGTVVSRGSSAASDFNANDAVQTINMNGAGLMGADSQHGTTSSFLSGVPVTSGSTTSPNSVLGENLHTLTATQIPTITGSNSNTFTLNGSGNGTTNSIPTAEIAGQLSTGQSAGPSWNQIVLSNENYGVNVTSVVVVGSPGVVSFQSGNTGGGSHNVVDRSVVTYWNLAL